ncbi:hypothetical protein Golomagni_05840 [Golovinomyces magnicellulatus]|nr:hypothetical protein Golomagni_05840 [Golovinomyces magnicellulatus]
MSDQNISDHTFRPVEQQDEPQRHSEQPGQQSHQHGSVDIPYITPSQYQAIREMILADIANQQRQQPQSHPTQISQPIVTAPTKQPSQWPI